MCQWRINNSPPLLKALPMSLTPEQKTAYADMVRHPGKFEGEPAYVPYFYDISLEGGEDDIIYDKDIAISVFEISDEDKSNWPELAEAHKLYLWETDQGFAEHRLAYSAEESNELESELSGEDEDPIEPDLNDYVMFPIGPLGGKTGVSQSGKYLGTFDEESDAEQFIRRHMEEGQFWPNVWYQDDHGGYTPRTI